MTTGGVCYNIIYEINDTKVPDGTTHSVGALGTLCFMEKIEVSAAEQMPVGTSLPEEPSEKQVEKIPVYPVGVSDWNDVDIPIKM